MLAGMSLPTTDEITRKEKEIKEALSYRMNEEDIDTVRSSASVTIATKLLYCFLLNMIVVNS